jgi:enoyl-[acyl-carrier protein] reductase II
MFEGDMNEGELEIGQVSAMMDGILPAGEIVKNMMEEFETERKRLSNLGA